jgi:hypothetical protein
MWFYSRMENKIYNFVTSTVQTIKHRVFGPNDADLYYFPILPSTIKSKNQQCLYPGRVQMWEKKRVGRFILMSVRLIMIHRVFM